MVGYYDLVSKAIVHFELMGQLLMSQLLMSQGILARSGWFVVFLRIQCGVGRGISLGTAILLWFCFGSCRLSHFDCYVSESPLGGEGARWS